MQNGITLSNPRKAIFTAFVVALATGVAVPHARAAEAFPLKPIRMIVPFSPGGTYDMLARILGQKMSEQWGQQV
jgi:tripartite-type tricarboxylate transporter receptor subunit TctC